MDVTRLSLARVLELGVPITWQEAAAIAFEAAAHACPDAPDTAVPLDAWMLTRGGELLVDVTAVVPPAAIADMTRRMLQSCADGAVLAQALGDGALADFLDVVGEDIPWRRRRVLIAAVALKGLVADAERPLPEADAPLAVRQYTRRAPRPDPTPRRVRARRRPPLPPPAPGRRMSVGARGVIWAAIAVSASVAGYGAWRATASSGQPPLPAPGAFAELPRSAHERPAPFRAPVVVNVAAEPGTEPARPTEP